MKRLLWICLLSAWVGVGWGVVASEPARDPNLPLRVRQTILPVFPRSALADGVTEGWARVVIDVDATGALSDWLVVGYTLPEFGDASVAALRRWEFEPMIINGQASPSQVAIAFIYEAKGVVIDITHGMDVARLWFRDLRGRTYRPQTLQELDGIPVPRLWVEPLYPADLAARGVSGSATVEFYIDEKGAVRMPAVVRADFPELGDLLADAVGRWEFEPPTVRGKPVLVHARQTVVFGKSG